MTDRKTPADKPMLAVIYARYSSAGQRDESIEGQLRDCHEFAQRNGLTVVGEYCDRALTGTSDKRPDFQRMIKDSAKGQFSTVICWKNDRFARSRYDSAIYKYKLKQNGVQVLYAKESIPDGPEGIILESVMEGYAEYYSANLSQNVKRGNYDSALKHQTLGRMVFGLRQNIEKRYEPDPATAPIVRRIFEEYAAGRAAVDIIADLNAEGYRTIRGGHFNKNSLRRILQNEKYIGVYRYDDIYDENAITPIVDKELFSKVQLVLKKHHEAPAAKKIEGGFLLTSKIFCGECGEPMTGDSGTGKKGTVYYYYTCNGRRKKKCDQPRIAKQAIEETVINALIEIISDDALIDSIADAFIRWQNEQAASAQLSSLEQRLKQNAAALKNALALIDSGFVTDSLKSHLVELEAERAALEKGIAKERLETTDIPRDAVVWFLQRFRTADYTDISWRIYIVETFLQAVYVYSNNKLLIQLNYTGKSKKASLQDAENAAHNGELLCSSFAPLSAPKRQGYITDMPLSF